MKRPFTFKVLFPLVLLFLVACGGHKQVTNNTIPITKNAKLLFINYTIEDQGELKVVKLINKKITDGVVKIKKHNFVSEPKTNDIKCVQLDKNHKEIHVDYLSNPLIKFTESLNDSLQFSRQKQVLKKAPISLKLQLHPNAHYLSLFLITKGKRNTNELITTKLN
ncbi:hypothetical protein [Seonamhaeicola sp.]|uniref:hypothetical protein n=1 Tax=Seonamhaeicola sp. TaxID=1912245 RepID=UPI003563785F